MSYRRLALLIAVTCVTGCGTSEVADAPRPVEVLKAPTDPVTPADLEGFLQIVRSLPQGKSPEYTSPANEAAVDQSLPGKTLVEEYRARFRKFFDPRRQGAVWARDDEWRQLLSRNRLTPAQFAALMRNVSCAITRVRLQSRFDVDRLVTQARAQVEDLVARLDRVDRFPANLISPEMAYERTQASLQLGPAVALLEFAELVKQVPAESQANVRRYSPQLQPLLAVFDRGDPFAELQKWDAEREGIQPASFEAPAGRSRIEDRR